jgi:hypothetical protein
MPENIDNSDFTIEFEVAPDGMTARVANWESPNGRTDLDMDTLQERVFAAGISTGLDHDGLADALDRITAGKSASGVVVARGAPAQEGVPGTLQPIGDHSRPVFPGDLVGIIVPPTSPAMGQDVRGNDLTPRSMDDPPALEPASDGSVSLNDSGELKAEAYGLVTIEDQTVRVEPLARVRDDRLRVLATIHPVNYRGEKTRVHAFSQVLSVMNVAARMASKNVQQGIDRAEASGQPVENVILAAGRKPKPGVDAWFETELNLDGSAGRESEDGRIDFTERGLVRSVKAGQHLGRIVPPEPGVPGMDVYGKVMPALDGRDLKMKAGKGVETDEEGRHFTAFIDGVLILTRDFIDVSEVLEINGDVNYSTGNIRMEKGSLHVHGTINPGFVVVCPGNVVVDDTIEGAQVTAGGDVVVRGGVVMKGEGFVKAGGCVTATHMANAVIEAGLDCVVSNEMVNSEITCGGGLDISKGKGRLMGGKIKVNDYVSAVEIGSHMGVMSEVTVGEAPARVTSLRGEIRELDNTVRKISSALGGEESDEAVLRRLPESKHATVKKLLEVRANARAKIEELEQTMALERQRIRESMRGEVRVKGVLYAGTVINMYGKRQEIHDDMKFCRLRYDPDEDAIKAVSYS